jgi:hypothetical protein
MLRLQWLTLALLAGMAALICLLPAPVPASAGTRPAAARGTATLEWQVRDASAPYPAIVLPSASAPWFGYAGAAVYFTWQPGDAAAVLYLPPPGCPDPQKPCASVCPPGGAGCFTAWVQYRRVDPSGVGDVTVLLLPNNLPFGEGWPGDPVSFVADPDGGGTLRWILPPQARR